MICDCAVVCVVVAVMGRRKLDSQFQAVGLPVGVTPHHSQEQLENVTYYTEASAADGKNVAVCKLLAQALTDQKPPPGQQATK